MNTESENSQIELQAFVNSVVAGVDMFGNNIYNVTLKTSDPKVLLLGALKNKQKVIIIVGNGDGKPRSRFEEQFD